MNKGYATSSASSKSTHNDFNSKQLNWFSYFKRTSNTFLPTFWKSFQVSSAVFHNILSTLKINASVSKKNVLKSHDSQIVPFKSSNAAYCTKNTENDPPDTPKKKDLQKQEDTPKTETEDTSYLEQIFHTPKKEASLQKEDLPKKETQDISYLEQIFHDWFSLGSTKEKSTEASEKNGKLISKVKKTLISKVSF